MSATTPTGAYGSPYEEDLIYPSRVSWGAILAGAAVAIVVGAVLNLLGVGIGMLSVDATAGRTPGATTFGIAAAAWTLVATILAMLVGGWTTGRLSRPNDQTNVGLHCLAMWAVASIVGAMIAWGAASGIAAAAGRATGAVVQGGATAIGGAAQAGASQIDPRALAERLSGQLNRADVASLSPEQAGVEISRLATQRMVQGELNAEDRQRLEALVARVGGISEDEARQRITAAEQQATQAVQRAEQEVREAADAAAAAGAIGAIWLFVTLLAGAAAAVVGGTMCVRHDVVRVRRTVAPAA